MNPQPEKGPLSGGALPQSILESKPGHSTYFIYTYKIYSIA